MNEEISQAYSRLTMHEFFIEIMLANWISEMSEEEGEVFLKKLRDKFRVMYTDDPTAGGDPAYERMQRDAIFFVNRFVDKLRTRSLQIRKEKSSFL